MLRNLRLSRPLVFIDLETTGLDPQRDRIVEIAMLRFAPDKGSRRFELLLNPQCAIPATATAIHSIKDMVVNCLPTFREMASKISMVLDNADLAGFGIARFDLPFLVAEFARAGYPF